MVDEVEKGLRYCHIVLLGIANLCKYLSQVVCLVLTDHFLVEWQLLAHTVDAVKRRVRAGMGRCQGGFCRPRVMEILSRELGVPLSAVRLGEKGSEIAPYEVKENYGKI